MECNCFLRSVQDLLADGKTLYETRFGEPIFIDPEDEQFQETIKKTQERNWKLLESSSSASFPLDPSSSSSSPARLRSDGEASGNRGDSLQIKNKNKKKGNNQATRRWLRDLPGGSGVHRESRGCRSACASTHFSWPSGSDENRWAASMEGYCYLRNVQDTLVDWKTLCERRFGEPFKGPIIPCGAMVEHCRISAREQARLHQFGKKVLPAIFWDMLGSRENLERRYSASWYRRIGNLDASEINHRTLNAKEVIITQKRRRICIPVADGTAKLSGRDYEFGNPLQGESKP